MPYCSHRHGNNTSNMQQEKVHSLLLHLASHAKWTISLSIPLQSFSLAPCPAVRCEPGESWSSPHTFEGHSVYIKRNMCKAFKYVSASMLICQLKSDYILQGRNFENFGQLDMHTNIWIGMCYTEPQASRSRLAVHHVLIVKWNITHYTQSQYS